MESRPRALGSRYELVSRLGTGAMGEVWRTLDRTTGEHVAAKLLRSEYVRDPEIVGRFVQERSILLSLEHPNIVRVRDLVVEGDALAIVMDLVEGADLRSRLRDRGTLPAREAVATACAVLDALDAAHRAGCLHRDVKPDNVLVADADALGGGDVRLTDFSIARLAQESTVMATGLLGTPGYMPPELFVHGTFSAASDVYAVGVLLYELLAGRTPFAGAGTAHTIGNRHVTVEPPRIPVDERLWHVLSTMLAKDPTLRLRAADTAALLRDLPEEVLAAPALPVQRDPEQWTAAEATHLPGGPVRVAMTPAGVDVGQTNLHARPVEQQQLAEPGDVRAFTPAATPGDQVTHVGRAAPAHEAPTLERVVTAAPPTPRPWLRWVVALACVVAVAAGGWALVGLFSGGDDDGTTTRAAAAPVSATLADEPLPTGLTVTRTATYDPEERVVSLTIRYASQTAPLAGPFLEVLPPARAGDDCPLVAWPGGDQARNIPQVTGIAVPCAFSVETPAIAEQGRVEVDAVVPLDLGEDPQAGLDAWLAAVSTTTAEAVAAQGSGTAYPVQRLDHIEVETPVSVRVGDDSLRVLLRPVWRGANGPDPVNLLYDSEAVGTPSSLLDQVAGGIDGVRLTDLCNGAVTILNERRVGVLRASDGCAIGARVGNFTDLESAPFRIAPAGG